MEKSGYSYRGVPVEDMAKEDLVKAIISMTKAQQETDRIHMEQWNTLKSFRSARS